MAQLALGVNAGAATEPCRELVAFHRTMRFTASCVSPNVAFHRVLRFTACCVHRRLRSPHIAFHYTWPLTTCSLSKSFWIPINHLPADIHTAAHHNTLLCTNHLENYDRDLELVQGKLSGPVDESVVPARQKSPGAKRFLHLDWQGEASGGGGGWEGGRELFFFPSEGGGLRSSTPHPMA